MKAARRGALSLVLVACVGLCPAPASAQAQNGEFVVNDYTSGNQGQSSVAADADGRFVVAWASPGSGIDLKARRFGPLGQPLGPEFLLSANDSGNQVRVKLAARPDGGFVAVWSGQGPPGETGVFARLFDANGTPLGPEFAVQAAPPAGGRPVVSVDGTGGFVVAWRTYPGGGANVLARRFTAAGTPVGGDIAVGSSTSFAAIDVGVAANTGGDFVVAWNNTINRIAARRFDAGGAPVDVQFQVNGSTAGTSIVYPRVAADPDGGFVVAWSRNDNPPPPPAPQIFNDYVFARSYDAAGVPRGSEFLAGTSHGILRALAPDANGTFVVAWHTSYVLTPGDPGVRAQRFDRAGRAVGPPFALNVLVHDDREPALAIDPLGNLVASWDASGMDGSGSAVLARRFRALHAASVLVDPAAAGTSDGNSVLEPGESVIVAPAWRNATQDAETITGSFSGFTGPTQPGVTYAIVDPAASYATVAAGDTRRCSDAGGDCYVLALGQSQARPLTHWDTTVSETLTPATTFPRVWTLHVGDSFSDVARTSPFYPFVEALLHRGVTAGCGSGAYCPAASTAREQMAVFLLLSKEGPAYLPPICTAPGQFFDVPVTSPFCRWIEELSRRGVTTGCGGGNYCPAAPVTRQEMAVFVLRTLDPALVPPACTVPVFNDVPASFPTCRWVEELARRGVVSGCGGGAYCPEAPVTREQMSVFLSVTFGLTIYGL
jgi:hypothetical protein